MSLKQVINKNRKNILRIAALHGASDVKIFGSVARGEDNETSDIDFLVKLESGRSLLDHAALLIDLGDLLGCKVDIITEKGLKEKIRARVLSEVVTL